MNRVGAALIGCAAFLSIVCNGSLAEQSSENLDKLLLSDEEITRVIRHGPWPPEQQTDPSNRVRVTPPQ